MIGEMVSGKMALSFEIAPSQLNHCSSLAVPARIKVTDKVPVNFDSKEPKRMFLPIYRFTKPEDISHMEEE